MIKAVLFDLGGVLVRLRAEEHLGRILGPTFTREQFWTIWAASPSVRALETGKIDPIPFSHSMAKELGNVQSPEDFLRDFAAWIAGPFPETAELLQFAKAHFTTALLTNTSALHWPVVEKLDVLRHIDCVHASFQVGLIKPDLDYFQAALARLGVSAEEAIFFDDSAVNIAAASSLGIRAHRVDGAAQVLAILKPLVGQQFKPNAD